jgi:hypothetical protein
VAIAQEPVRKLSYQTGAVYFWTLFEPGDPARHADIVVIASAMLPVYPDWLEKLIEPFKDEKVAGLWENRAVVKLPSSPNCSVPHWFPDTSDYDQNTPSAINANAPSAKAMGKPSL